MEVTIVAIVAIVAVSSVFGYALRAMLQERNKERLDFMKELRRKHYLDAGARPDEAANAVITEDLDRTLADLAKNMPKSDNPPKRLDPPDVLELPNGVRIKREM